MVPATAGPIASPKTAAIATKGIAARGMNIIRDSTICRRRDRLPRRYPAAAELVAGQRKAQPHMIRRLVMAACMAVTLVACSSGGSKAVNLTAGQGGPDPYDVAAARLCKAFYTYVRDARQGKPSAKDSATLDKAQASLKSGHWSNDRWKLLSTDVDVFITDASHGHGDVLAQEGLKIGQVCSTIPGPARRAGGFA
jgi:hypothetical protein